jgi:hypothetical protein
VPSDSTPSADLISLFLEMPVDPVLKANVYNSIFNPNAYQTWGIPQYVCSSENCTWDPVTSLEARSRCTDLTSRMHRSCGWSTVYGAVRCNLTIPNGASAWYLIGTKTNWAAQALVLELPKTPLIYTNESASYILHTQIIMVIGLDASLGAEMTQSISNDTE